MVTEFKDTLRRRKLLSHTLLVMGALELLPLGCIVWASITAPNEADPPLAIKIELLGGFIAASVAPILIAVRIRHGYGLLAAKLLFLILFPFVIGEISLPVFLILKHQPLPSLMAMLLALFLIHALTYATASYFYVTAQRTGD